jgi:hypothetical protein
VEDTTGSQRKPSTFIKCSGEIFSAVYLLGVACTRYLDYVIDCHFIFLIQSNNKNLVNRKKLKENPLQNKVSDII